MTPYNPGALLEILNESRVNLTARAYIKKIAACLNLPPSKAKAILRQMVDDQMVTYQDLYGSTYVMESFLKPVRITDRFFIIPPGIKSIAGPDEIDIRIHQGISFGSGHHPTTRLCLDALDQIFFKDPGFELFPGKRAGDIGTGSAILAIAACLAGMDHCTAWEIDANAISEARKNIAANSLEKRIPVIDGLMAPAKDPLTLICANLRYPTLKLLAPSLAASLLAGGYLILSGLRSWEKQDLVTHYQDYEFTLFWEKELKDWAGLVLTLES